MIQSKAAPSNIYPGNSNTGQDPSPAMASEFTYPVDPVTHAVTGYGFEVVNNEKGEFDHIHPGEDWNRIGAAGDGDLGDPVFSIANGFVKFAGMTSVGFGNAVLIEHMLPDGKKIWSQYAHLDQVLVVDGQRVSRGQQVGTIGKTGGFTNAHLHFEIRIKDLPVDSWQVSSWNTVLENYIDPINILPEMPRDETNNTLSWLI
jgi:murein DD-endopeptidase MepM/ murein hydrolase activator NlpD